LVSGKYPYALLGISLEITDFHLKDGQWMCAGGEGKDACQGKISKDLLKEFSGLYYNYYLSRFWRSTTSSS
jgi:hypothetical protein